MWSDLVGHFAPAPGLLTNVRTWQMAGGEVEVIVRDRRLVLRSLSPVGPLRRGVVLHAADPDDPMVFVAEAQGLAIHVAFTSNPAGGPVASVVIGPPSNTVFHRRSSLRSLRVRRRVATVAGTALVSRLVGAPGQPLSAAPVLTAACRRDRWRRSPATAPARTAMTNTAPMARGCHGRPAGLVGTGDAAPAVGKVIDAATVRSNSPLCNVTVRVPRARREALVEGDRDTLGVADGQGGAEGCREGTGVDSAGASRELQRAVHVERPAPGVVHGRDDDRLAVGERLAVSASMVKSAAGGPPGPTER